MLTDILLLLAGVVVGAMNAIAGGGGLVAFPILVATGLPAIVADATNFIVSFMGQASAVVGYRKYFKKLSKLYLLLIIPCAIGAYFGSELLKHTSSSSFDKYVPFLIILTVVIFALQPFFNKHLLGHIRSRNKNYWVLGVICLVLTIMCVYGGYFGVGLGFAILSVLGFIRPHEMHTLVAIKCAISLVVMIVAIANISSTGLIRWQPGLVMAIGTVIGGYGGAHLAQKVSSYVIRWVVIVIGLACALLMLYLYR